MKITIKKTISYNSKGEEIITEETTEEIMGENKYITKNNWSDQLINTYILIKLSECSFMSRSLILSKDQIEKANKISNSSVKHFKSSMTVSYS